MSTVSHDIRHLLDTEAARINSPAFIADDPVQFPRRYTRLQDIEIAALLSATVAWGRRCMICSNIDRMLEMMDGEPYHFVMEEAYRQVNPDRNLHRTFFGRDLQWLLAGLREVYRRYPSLDAMCADATDANDPAPAWTFAEALEKICADTAGRHDTYALPSKFSTTALKRINMMLRWLVRDDGIVDLGVWRSIPKSKLYIPLDVHVGNVARGLGLLERRSNDRRAVEMLTSTLRGLRPDDPCVYDYALFGIGVEGAGKHF